MQSYRRPWFYYVEWRRVALYAFLLICLLIITVGVFVMSTIAMVVTWQIYIRLDNIGDVIELGNNAGLVVSRVNTYTRAFEEATSSYNLTKIIRDTLPDTDEEVAARLVEVGGGVRSAGDIVAEVKAIDMVGMFRPILKVIVQLSGRPESAVFAKAVSEIGEYIAKHAETGDVDAAFAILKEVVLMTVDTLKKKSVQESLTRLQKTIDEAQQDDRVQRMIDDMTNLLDEARTSKSVISMSDGLRSLGNFTSLLGALREDFENGGLSISLPGFRRSHKNVIAP